MNRRFVRTLPAGLILLAGLGAAFVLGSCERPNALADAERPAGSDGWLTGTPHEKFDTLAAQFGGFSQAMVEVGYRYTELHWAGEDENWEFAEYQLEHLVEAMDLGFERRPARRASAEMFMNIGVPQMEQAIAERDRAVFRERFASFAAHCNACHAMEAVPFIHVEVPTVRYLPWGTRPRPQEQKQED